MNELHGYENLGVLTDNSNVVGYVAQSVARTIELVSEKALWKAKLDALRFAFDRYGRTEENVLLERELSAEVLKLAMYHAAKIGDSQAIVTLYKEFNKKSPDFLGQVIQLIKSNESS
jgi:hypothetical protein